MAVLPMLKVSIYGLKKDRKQILEALQRRGVVDVKDIDLKKEGIERLNTSAHENTFSKAINLFENAISVLEIHSPENKSMFDSLNGKKELSLKDYYTFVSETDTITQEANQVLKLSKKIGDSKLELARLESQKKGIQPWLSLDVPMNFKGTKKTAVFIGTFSESISFEKIMKNYEEELLRQGLKKENYPIEAEVVSSDDNQTCVVVFCRRDAMEKVEGLLRLIGFSAPVNTFSKTPKDVLLETEDKQKELIKLIEKSEEKLKNLSGMRNAFKFMIDYYTMRLEKYQVLSTVNQMGKVFCITGYIPEKLSKDLEAEFTKKYPAAVELEKPEDKDAPPVLLENNGFAEPCEGVLETFSLPAKGEIDPTFVMSIFYYILFGLMLSDCAYGLIMVIVCALALWKFKNMDTGLKKALKMYLYCGISTAFWGAMFGSFFGDAVQVISSTYFGKEIAFKPLWFEPIKDPMKMLIFSFTLGIIHLFAGLGMKFYQNIKQKQYKDAIYDTVFWYLLVGGGIAYLLSTDMFVDMANLSFRVSPFGAKLAAIAAGVGAVGIVLTDGRSSKNPAIRIAKGLYGLYNVTGYLSDILSYSRLLALGLATGVIAQVFNKMGSMLGSGPVGFILFMIVFVIGHTLNIGVNLLGAYVHTNRLQFVEFFGKFYEGGGEKYAPFSAKTKYYKIREDV